MTRSETVSVRFTSQAWDTAQRGRAETRELVLRVVAMQGRATRLQIARWLGRVKTPHLVQIIEELVYEGYLHRTHGRVANGALVYLYEVRRDDDL